MKKLILGAITLISLVNVGMTSVEASELIRTGVETNVIYEDEMLTEKSAMPKLGYFNAYSIKRNGYNTVNADFVGNKKTSTNPSMIEIGLKPNKYVKQCYVRIKEGNYDSNRQWSSVATSTSDKERRNAYAQKFDNPIYVAESHWGWSYR